MKLGFIGIRWPKGIGVQMEDYAHLAESIGHEVYFLSYPLSHRKPCLVDGEWKRKNVTIINTFHRNTVKISDEAIITWILLNKIDAVFMMEEPNNLNTYKICNKLDIPVINYVNIEMFNPDLRDFYKDCTLFMCPTQMCYDTLFQYGYKNLMLVKYMANINKYPWKLRKVNNGESVQFVIHSGWNGMNGRKGTEPTIRAFVSADRSNTSLTVITQKKWKTYDEETQKIVSKCKRIKIQETNDTKVVYNSSAYTCGHIVVQPSKWEGLGLTYIEAMACGLPAISVKAPPMCEFIEHDKTGWLVEADMVPGSSIDKDLKIKVALVKEEKLTEAICLFADNPDYIERMSSETEKFRNRYSEHKQAFADMLNRVRK